MQISRQQIPAISRDIIKALVDHQEIAVPSAREAALDVESVLSSYLNSVDQVLSSARDLVQQRGLPQGEFGRIKTLVAEQQGIKLGDDALDYVLDQLIEMMMYSDHIEEVFAEDHQLRRRMRDFLMANSGQDQAIEAEVRSQLKHVQEGSRVWEIEYQRLKADIRRRRGL